MTAPRTTSLPNIPHGGYRARCDGEVGSNGRNEEQDADRYQAEGVEALSNAEFLRVRSWYRGTQIRMESQFYQWEQGFLEDNAIEVTLNVISETAYATWEALDLVKNINPPAWKEIIQSRVRGVPAS